MQRHYGLEQQSEAENLVTKRLQIRKINEQQFSLRVFDQNQSKADLILKFALASLSKLNSDTIGSVLHLEYSHPPDIAYELISSQDYVTELTQRSSIGSALEDIYGPISANVRSEILAHSLTKQINGHALNIRCNLPPALGKLILREIESDLRRLGTGDGRKHINFISSPYRASIALRWPRRLPAPQDLQAAPLQSARSQLTMDHPPSNAGPLLVALMKSSAFEDLMQSHLCPSSPCPQAFRFAESPDGIDMEIFGDAPEQVRRAVTSAVLVLEQEANFAQKGKGITITGSSSASSYLLWRAHTDSSFLHSLLQHSALLSDLKTDAVTLVEKFRNGHVIQNSLDQMTIRIKTVNSILSATLAHRVIAALQKHVDRLQQNGSNLLIRVFSSEQAARRDVVDAKADDILIRKLNADSYATYRLQTAHSQVAAVTNGQDAEYLEFRVDLSQSMAFADMRMDRPAGSNGPAFYIQYKGLFQSVVPVDIAHHRPATTNPAIVVQRFAPTFSLPSQFIINTLTTNRIPATSTAYQIIVPPHFERSRIRPEDENSLMRRAALLLPFFGLCGGLLIALTLELRSLVLHRDVHRPKFESSRAKIA